MDGVVPARSKENVWQQGVAWVYYNDKESSIVTVPINDGVLVFNGLIYEGNEDEVLDHLEATYPDYQF